MVRSFLLVSYSWHSVHLWVVEQSVVSITPWERLQRNNIHSLHNTSPGKRGGASRIF